MTNTSRRGVALIVVLGFLSIMIMMAVAFLTQARMERQVANMTLEAMRGRQILRTALHAAMNDYSAEMASASLVMAPYNSAFDLFVSQPPRPLFGLPGNRTIGQDNIELLVGEVVDWIPRKYTNSPFNAVTAVPSQAEWILVREDPASSQPSRILGRYAYAIFDMSGGIDANLIARDANVAGNDARIASNRIRRSVRQMPMGMLPETANASQFKSYRRGWKGFDSLQTVIKLADGKPNDGSPEASDGRWQPERKEGNPPAGLHSNLVSDLTPFSLSVFRGGRYTPASATWSPYVLFGSQPWATVLNPIASQFGGSIPAWIDDAINDYTNSSPVPIGLDYPSPKNVPMFNELDLSYRLIETPEPGPTGWSSYQLEVRLTPEFWYPFPSQDNAAAPAFQMTPPTVGGSPAPSPGPGANNIWFHMMMMPPLPVNFGAVTMPGPLSVAAQYNTNRPYLATGGGTNFVYMIPLQSMVPLPTPAPNPAFPLPSGRQLLVNSVTVSSPINLQLASSGALADQIPSGLVLSPTPTTLLPNDVAGPPRVWEVTDPRLNYLPGQWALMPSPSLGAQNVWDPTVTARFIAEGTNLYCRNAPMETPAELGFIPNGQIWGTIDLCTPDAADMLANLVTDTNLFAQWSANGVFYTNGTINPNTRSTNVLASAFFDLTRHEVPNVDTAVVAANPIDEDLANNLAQSIADVTSDGLISTAFQAGSDWVRVPAMQQGGAFALMGLNNNQRESLLRNTWGLFSTDNSLFTVVLVAQAIKEAPDSIDTVGQWNPVHDMITGERRAVALVWRDPFANGNNLHREMFVRMFRYLND